MTRRGLWIAGAGLVLAPAIVRAESLMPIKVWREPKPTYGMFRVFRDNRCIMEFPLAERIDFDGAMRHVERAVGVRAGDAFTLEAASKRVKALYVMPEDAYPLRVVRIGFAADLRMDQLDSVTIG